MTDRSTHWSTGAVVGAVALTAVAVGIVAYAIWPADGNHPPRAQAPAVAPSGGRATAAVGVDAGLEKEQREPAVASVGGSGATPVDADEVPVTIEELPEDLRKDARAAIQACRHGCDRLGIPFALSTWPRLRPSDARRLIEREAALKKQQLESALMEQEILFARMSANPAIGIKVPSAERARLDALLKEKYPGWPDGYRFAEESDGISVWIAAWKVAGDAELEQLVRDHDALTGEYSASIRAGYRVYFHY